MAPPPQEQSPGSPKNTHTILLTHPPARVLGPTCVREEAILARRPDGRFEKVLGIELTAVEARALGRHEGVLVAEDRRAALRPLSKLAQVRHQGLAPLALPVGW